MRAMCVLYFHAIAPCADGSEVSELVIAAEEVGASFSSVNSDLTCFLLRQCVTDVKLLTPGSDQNILAKGRLNYLHILPNDDIICM